MVSPVEEVAPKLYGPLVSPSFGHQLRELEPYAALLHSIFRARDLQGHARIC